MSSRWLCVALLLALSCSTRSSSSGDGAEDAAESTGGDTGDESGDDSDDSAGDDAGPLPDQPPTAAGLGESCFSAPCEPGLQCLLFPIAPNEADALCVTVGAAEYGEPCDLNAERIADFESPCAEGLVCNWGICSSTYADGDCPEGYGFFNDSQPALHIPVCRAVCDEIDLSCPDEQACMMGSLNGVVSNAGCVGVSHSHVPEVGEPCGDNVYGCQGSICVSESQTEATCRAWCSTSDPDCPGGLPCVPLGEIGLSWNSWDDVVWDGLCF